MIAVEKFRAICQQMPEYTLNRTPSPRARDFFDIHLIVSKTGTNSKFRGKSRAGTSNLRLKRSSARTVSQHQRFREFHRPDWESVRTSVKGELQSFDYYLDFVVRPCQLNEVPLGQIVRVRNIFILSQIVRQKKPYWSPRSLSLAYSFSGYPARCM